MKQKIIQFEGLDGTFKETNSNLIKDYLQLKGYNAHIMHFPRYDSDSSIFARKYLNSEYKDISDPYIISTFFAYDMLDAFEELKNRADYNDIKFIICDRYIGSNMIYQSTLLDKEYKDKKNLTIQKLKFINKLDRLYDKLNLPKPDLTIYLNLKPELSNIILQNRTNTDIYESNLKYLKSVYNTGKLVSTIKSWNIVNCQYNDSDISLNNVKNKTEIFTDIKRILEKELNIK